MRLGGRIVELCVLQYLINDIVVCFKIEALKLEKLFNLSVDCLYVHLSNVSICIFSGQNLAFQSIKCDGICRLIML